MGNARIRGFTAPELLTVMAVAGVLISIAAPSFNTFTAQQRIKMVSSDLYLSMAKARSDAVKLNRNIVVQPLTAGGWQSGWGIWDPVNNAYLDQRAAVNADTAITQGPASVTYQASGRIAGGVATQFQVASESLPTRTTPRCLLLDPSGRPYVKGAAC